MDTRELAAFSRKPSRKCCLIQLYPVVDAAKPRDDVPPVGPQAQLRALRTQDWWFESGTELRSWCPAAVYSACEACGLPCLPVGKAGSDWTHERVPQKPNRNALRVSPCCVSCPAGTAWRRRCSRGANGKPGCPNLLIQVLDAQALHPVQNIPHFRIQRKRHSALSEICIAALGIHASTFPFPAGLKTRTGGIKT